MCRLGAIVSAMSDSEDQPKDERELLRRQIIALVEQINGKPLEEWQLRLLDKLPALPASPGSFVAAEYLSRLLH
jgi:hypothetical protein